MGEVIEFRSFCNFFRSPCNAQLTAAFSSLAKSTLTVVLPNGKRQGAKGSAGGCAGVRRWERGGGGHSLCPFCYFWW